MIVVTIPAFNEEKTIGGVIRDVKSVMDGIIGGVIRDVKSVMDGIKEDYTILVVDDCSRDRTAEIAKKAGAKVVSHPLNYGLAEAFRTEMKECLKLNPSIIIHIDADGQYNASEIPLLIKKIKDGNELVLGSRFKGHIEHMPFMKKIGNKMFSRAISNIVGMRISDAQTGFRAFTRQVAEDVKITSNHTYTQEQIIRAVRQKFRVIEVPASFAKREGKSRLIKNPFEYAAKAWINILRVLRDYKPLKFFGVIGGFFIGLGILMGLWILYTLATTGGVGGIPRVILSALFIITGVQIVLFGFFADMFRK